MFPWQHQIYELWQIKPKVIPNCSHVFLYSRDVWWLFLSYFIKTSVRGQGTAPPPSLVIKEEKEWKYFKLEKNFGVLFFEQKESAISWRRRLDANLNTMLVMEAISIYLFQTFLFWRFDRWINVWPQKPRFHPVHLSAHHMSGRICYARRLDQNTETFGRSSKCVGLSWETFLFF